MMSEVLSREPLLETEDTQKDKFLTFALDAECYGIEIKFVTEIVGIQAITELPELPDYLKGIINLRGKIIPVMDVRLRFKKAAVAYNERTCIIVVDIHGVPVGLIVDSVAEVLDIAESNIVPPPQLQKSAHQYIRAIGKVDNDVKLLLDCSSLLHESEVGELKDIKISLD